MVLHFNIGRECELSCSVVSDSLRPHGLKPTVLLCPWNSPGKLTGAGCAFLLHGIFPTQGSNPCLLSCRWLLVHWATREAPHFSISSYQLLNELRWRWRVCVCACMCVCMRVCMCADGFLEKWNAVEYKDVHIFHLLLKPPFLLYAIRKP